MWPSEWQIDQSLPVGMLRLLTLFLVLLPHPRPLSLVTLDYACGLIHVYLWLMHLEHLVPVYGDALLAAGTDM